MALNSWWASWQQASSCSDNEVLIDPTGRLQRGDRHPPTHGHAAFRRSSTRPTTSRLMTSASAASYGARSRRLIWRFSRRYLPLIFPPTSPALRTTTRYASVVPFVV